MRDLREIAPYAIGGSVAAAVAWLWWASRSSPSSALVHVTYNGQAAPAQPGPAPGVPAQWLAFPVEGKAIPLSPGVRYRAAIDLPFGAGVLATDARVRDRAASMGFRDVTIARETPAGWPELDDADLFVEATYAGDPRWLERDARIVGAWAFV